MVPRSFREGGPNCPGQNFGGTMIKIHPSEITPEHIYLSRRKFMKGIGALAASSALLAACGGQDPGSALPTLTGTTDNQTTTTRG